MKLNSFEHALNMPQSVPVDERHPFLLDQNAVEEETSAVPSKQYVAHLPERKEWQAQLPPQQDAARVFRPVGEERD